MARGNRNKNKNNKTLYADESRLSLANLIATDDVEKLEGKQVGKPSQTSGLDNEKQRNSNGDDHNQKDATSNGVAASDAKSESIDSTKDKTVSTAYKISKKSKKGGQKKDAKSVAAKIQEATAKPHTDEIEPLEKKKQAPPTLLELKTYVTRFSELIQDYDITSTNPFTNAAIKTNKNTVDVPENWKQKRGYLTSRSLMEKPNFELPDLIKQTGIQELRQIDAFGDSSGENNSSLKEDTRARIQPKMNVLDLDYKKLYDVIFKIGANWKPDNMLQFGDLYYENREMDFYNTLEGYDQRFRPGKLSESLLSALGYHQNGRLPVWCISGNVAKQKQGGKGNVSKKTDSAKSGSPLDEHTNCFNNHYNMNVLNRIDKDGVYAQLTRKRKKGGFAGKTAKAGRPNNKNSDSKLFGAKINTFIDLSDLDGNNEKNEKAVVEEVPKEQVQEQITELAPSETKTTELPGNDKNDEKAAPKKLYKVMEVKSLQDGKYAYELDRSEKVNDAPSSIGVKKDQVVPHKEKEITEDKEFKF
ncbi:hypothetical protein ACO0QE_003363 [Hanseniaspora vineae]